MIKIVHFSKKLQLKNIKISTLKMFGMIKYEITFRFSIRIIARELSILFRLSKLKKNAFPMTRFSTISSLSQTKRNLF
jgi:hypothetical protein